MTTENFNKKWAEKHNDASLWTPKDCFEDALRLCAEKNITKTVVVYNYEENGQTKLGYLSAGATSRNDAIGLLSLQLHCACQDTLEV